MGEKTTTLLPPIEGFTGLLEEEDTLEPMPPLDVEEQCYLKPVSANDQQTVDMLTELVMSAHGRVLEESAGLPVATGESRRRVESVVYSVFSAHPESYDSLESQVAEFMSRLASDHCFADGNKRTALLSAITVMEAYGRLVRLSVDDAVAIALMAADGETSQIKSKFISN